MTDHAALYDQIAALPDDTTLHTLVREMAATLPAQEHLNAFNATLDLLAYHGRTSALATLLQEAWPHLRNSDRTRPEARANYAALGGDVTLFHYLENTAEPDPADPALLQPLSNFFAIEAGPLAAYLGVLAGRLGRPWSPADFEPTPAASIAANLNALSAEYLGYLHSVEGAPFTKGNLARHLIPAYLQARQRGDLLPRQDVGALLRGGGRPVPQPPPPAHPMLPDPATLDLYLERLTTTVNARPYAAAAVRELLPAWERFLQQRGLVGEHKPSN